MTSTSTVDRAWLDQVVQAYLDGRISDEDADYLEANHPLWVDSLWRLLESADQTLERARQNVRGPERVSVLNDLEDECDRIDALLTDLIGPLKHSGPDPDAIVAGTAQLQLSWNHGQIVAWGGGHEAEPASLESLTSMLEEHDGGAISWLENDPVDIAGRAEAPALAAQLTLSLIHI